MHILILPTEPYLCSNYPLGGIFQHHQALALYRANCKVGVISPCIEPFSQILRIFEKYGISKGVDHEIPVYRYYGYNLFPKIARGTYWSWLRAGMSLFRRYISDHGRPDIIHAHNIIFAGALAEKIKKKYGIPFLLTEHSSEYARGLFSQQLEPQIKIVLKAASIKTVVSTSLGKLLFNFFGPCAEPYYPIYNVLDNMFTLSSPLPKKVTGKKVFLNIAALEPNKDHESLLQAFADAFRGRNNFQLRIGGDGSRKIVLEQKAVALGINEQVVFLGQLGRDAVLYEYINSDVFVLSSKYETFGVVLIEALACGKPVIATACGGPEDIVNQNNGILVPANDIRLLGQAMENIIERYNNYNPHFIRDECLAKYGETAFTDRILELYSKAISSSIAK